jgi:putative holliday junction resolvase
MRRAGIDPGSARTGVAVAEDDVPVATPLCTVTHRGLEDALTQVASLLAAERIEQVVVGLPLAMNGREGDAARKARRFAERLEARSGVPVVLWDERLTTVAALRAQQTLGVRAQAGRGQIDQAAATLILQSYLDSQRDRPWPDDPMEMEPSAPRSGRRERDRRG